MDVIQRDESMSLYGTKDEEKFILESMGIAYKLDDDALWFVKVPIDNNNPVREEAVMVRVEGSDPADHTEYDDELVPERAVDNLMSWYSSFE